MTNTHLRGPSKGSLGKYVSLLMGSTVSRLSEVSLQLTSFGRLRRLQRPRLSGPSTPCGSPISLVLWPRPRRTLKTVTVDISERSRCLQSGVWWSLLSTCQHSVKTSHLYPFQAAQKKKPFSGDLGLTGQHRDQTNDDYKPPLKGSEYYGAWSKRRLSIRRLQVYR